jgi:hypothetical protein
MTHPTDLPPLPVGAVYTRAMGSVGASMYTYTADQMREYARAAVLAERERCALLCDALALEGPARWKHGTPTDCADSIRTQEPLSRGEATTLRAAL